MSEGYQKVRDYKYKENDPNYRGNDLDHELASGPLENRSCQDCLFFIIFTIFWAGIIAVAVTGFRNGDPARLASPYDNDGNHCGYDVGFTDYPLVYFSQPSLDYSKYVCVSECPATNTSVLKCITNSQVKSCVEPDVQIYATTKLINFCLPRDNALWNGIKDYVKVDNSQQYLHDVKISWGIMLASAGIAFVSGFIFMFLLKICASILIWGAILLYLALLGVIGWMFLRQSQQSGANEVLTIASKEISNKKELLLTFAIIFWVLDGISLIAVICLFNRIRLAIAVIQAASDFVRDVWEVMLVPIIMFVVSIIFLVFWFISTLFLYSCGEFSKRGSTPLSHVKWNDTTRGLLVYNVIALIWNIEFLIAFSQTVLAGVCCIWYFGQGYGNNVHAPVRRSFFRVIRYHIGSLALGSIILTFIWVVRIVFEFFHRHLKNVSDGSENCCSNFIYKCIHCCIDCFERFIRFLNRKSFIQIALGGKSFCSSASDAFYLLLRNAGRFAAVSGVGTIIIWMGKLFICVATGLIGYLIITSADYYEQNLYSPVVPTIFFVLISYLVSNFFMSVYGMAADTILHCFCVDEEIHSKRGSSAQHCPQALKSFIESHI